MNGIDLFLSYFVLGLQVVYLVTEALIESRKIKEPVSNDWFWRGLFLVCLVILVARGEWISALGIPLFTGGLAALDSHILRRLQTVVVWFAGISLVVILWRLFVLKSSSYIGMLPSIAFTVAFLLWHCIRTKSGVTSEGRNS